MKKLMRSTIGLITSVLVMGGMITSCLREETTITSEKPQSFYSETAKLEEWYKNNDAIVHSKDNWLRGLSPDWKRTETSIVDGYKVYEISLQNPNHVFSASKDIDSKKAGDYQGSSLVKLVILEDQTNGRLIGRFMEIIALKNSSAISKMRYKDYGNFSGSVNFYQLTGTLLKGWLYENGRAVGTTDIRKMLELQYQMRMNPGKKESASKLVDATACGTISVPHWREVCIGVGGIDGWGYGGDSGVTTCHWEVYHTTEIIYCPNTDGSDDGGAGTGGGGGLPPDTGSNPNEGQNDPQEFEFISDPAIDLKDLFKCFNEVPDTNATYSISLQADLPIDTDPDALVNYLTFPPFCGHAFITMTKTNGLTRVTKSFGFYPQSQVLSLWGTATPSKMNDNGDHEYDARIVQHGLNAAQFQGAMSKALDIATRQYGLSTYNCTDYALDVFNSVRDDNNKITVPDWVMPWGSNYGTTPNGLYNKLQQMKNANTTPGITIGKDKAAPKTPPCTTQ